MPCATGYGVRIVIRLTVGSPLPCVRTSTRHGVGGFDGRVSRRLEDELCEDALVQSANEFLDALVDGFKVLGRVADGEVAADDLRKASLLGSTTMLRALAGVFHDLTAGGSSSEEIAEFFKSLEPFMDAPVSAESPWVVHVPNEIFSEGSSAPKARRQDLHSPDGDHRRMGAHKAQLARHRIEGVGHTPERPPLCRRIRGGYPTG